MVAATMLLVFVKFGCDQKSVRFTASRDRCGKEDGENLSAGR